MTVIGNWSLPVLILTHESFIVFLLPCPVEEGEWWSGFSGHLAFIQAKPEHMQTCHHLCRRRRKESNIRTGIRENEAPYFGGNSDLINLSLESCIKSCWGWSCSLNNSQAVQLCYIHFENTDRCKKWHITTMHLHINYFSKNSLPSHFYVWHSCSISKKANNKEQYKNKNCLEAAILRKVTHVSKCYICCISSPEALAHIIDCLGSATEF